MNVEIGNVAAQFLFWEKNGIFVAVQPHEPHEPTHASAASSSRELCHLCFRKTLAFCRPKKNFAAP